MFMKKYSRARCKPVLDETVDWAKVGNDRVLRRSGINGGLIYEHFGEPVALFSGDLAYFNCSEDRSRTAILTEAVEIFGLPIEVRRKDGEIQMKYAGIWRPQNGSGHISIRIARPARMVVHTHPMP
jgi:hypothetical protein